MPNTCPDGLAPHPSWSIVGVFLICLAAAPLRADGDDFFVQPLNPDGTPVVEGGYAGTVRDESGRGIADATVKIVVTVETAEGPYPLELNAYSDALGRYRSRDPKIVFADFLAEGVGPRSIELIVLKEGYEVIRRFRRGRLDAGGPYETDFTLRKKPH